MSWKLRHEGSPRAIDGLNPQRIVEGLQDGQWESADEVMGPGDTTWVAIENHPQFSEIIEDLEPPPPRPHEEETNLDMTPLIDVTQVLLIFFILTTSYSRLQAMIDAPGVNASKAGPPVVSKEEVQETMILVRVSQSVQGEPVVQVEQEMVALEDVVGALKSHRGAAKKRVLLLDCDPRVPHGVVVTIQDYAKSAGMDRVLFLIPSKEAPRPPAPMP